MDMPMPFRIHTRGRLAAALDWMHSAPTKQPDVIGIGFLTLWPLLAMFGGFYKLDPLEYCIAFTILCVQAVRVWMLRSYAARCFMAMFGFVACAFIGTASVHSVHALPGLLAGAIMIGVNEALTVSRFSLWADTLPPLRDG